MRSDGREHAVDGLPATNEVCPHGGPGTEVPMVPIIMIAAMLTLVLMVALMIAPRSAG